MPTDVRIDSRQRVVEQVDIGLAVDGSGQADSLLLTATQCYTTFAYLINAHTGKHRAQSGVWTMFRLNIEMQMRYGDLR